MVAFYLAALGIIQTVPDNQESQKNSAYLVVLIIGAIAAPLYIAIVGGKVQPGSWLMAIWSIPAFLIWAYNLGGMFKVWGIHEPWIGSLALLAITLVAGRLPIPREGWFMFKCLYDLFAWIPPGMLVPDKFPESRAFIRTMQIEAAPFVASRTIVLYGASEAGIPYILGTGVPLAVAVRHLILTAAHVFDDVKPEGQAVYISPGSAGGKLIPLDPLQICRSARPACGKLHVRPSARRASGDRKNDHFDTALVFLPPEVAAQIGPGIIFCQLSDLDPFDNQAPGSYYFLNGFPSKNLMINCRKNTVSCRSLLYGTIVYNGDRGPWPLPAGAGVPPDLHIDLDFHPRRAADDAGRRTRLPSPYGISGCGFWRLSQAGVDRDDWSVAHIKLVAIENRYDEILYVLRGTRIKYFNTILAKKVDGALAAIHAAWGGQG